MASVQGVNRIGYCGDQGCLSEVVVIHERKVRDETRHHHSKASSL